MSAFDVGQLRRRAALSAVLHASRQSPVLQVPVAAAAVVIYIFLSQQLTLYCRVRSF